MKRQRRPIALWSSTEKIFSSAGRRISDTDKARSHPESGIKRDQAGIPGLCSLSFFFGHLPDELVQRVRQQSPVDPGEFPLGLGGQHPGIPALAVFVLICRFAGLGVRRFFVYCMFQSSGRSKRTLPPILSPEHIPLGPILFRRRFRENITLSFETGRQNRQQMLAGTMVRTGWRKGCRCTISAVIPDVADEPALSFDMQRELMQMPGRVSGVFIPGSSSA